MVEFNGNILLTNNNGVQLFFNDACTPSKIVAQDDKQNE